jgi:hypothetical protein
VQEQLLVGEPGPRRSEFVAVTREVDRDPGVGGVRKPMAGAQLGRQRLEHTRRQRQGRPDPFAEPLDPQALAAGMDRDDPGGMEARGRPRRVADRVGSPLPRLRAADDLERVGTEAATVGPSAQQHADAGLQLVGQPCLVEPGDVDRAGPVGDRRLDDSQVAASRRPQP